jgi:hypothetical protein
LKCQDTIDRYPEILQAATIILQQQVDKTWSINETIQTRYTKPTTEAIWDALGATDNTVLDSPISKGIITQTLVDSFKRKVLVVSQTQTQNARNPPFITEDTIEMATASLTSAIYHEIWKPRTKYIFSENSKLEYEQKQRKWRKDKADKQEKKDQAKQAKKANTRPPKPTGKKPESNKKRTPKEEPIIHRNLKRDIKRNRPPQNQYKRKDRKPLAEPKKPKEKKTGHQDQPNPQEIAQYSVPHRPKRKLQERQEMYPSPKKKRKDCHDEKP